MQCRVEQDLINYELKMEKLEQAWDASLPTKRHQVVELGKKILAQEVDRYTFEVAFADQFDFSDDVDYEILISTLTEMEKGECTDMKMVSLIASLALDGAAYCLFDIELKELLDDAYTERHMIKEVLE